jgi:pimeloyl-ACP methyl ester carboxylesterase
MTAMQNLMMIPALGCTQALYAPQRETLRRKFKLQTHMPTEDRFPAMVAGLLAVAPAAFYVMGTSMGARLALETTLAAPDRVKGLIMIGAGAGPVANQAAGLHRSTRLRSGEFDNVVTEMADMISHLEGPKGPSTRSAFVSMCQESGAELMARQSDALAHRTDLRPRLEEVTCPVLLIWGNQDQFSPTTDGATLNHAIVGSRFAILGACGHLPTLEYPEETNKLLRDWLKLVDP